MSDTPSLSRRGLLAGASVAATALTAVTSACAQTPLKAGAGGGPPKVAILIDEPATLIDFAGVWQALDDAPIAGVPGFEVYSVGPEIRPLRVYGGLLVTPNHTFETAPQPDIVIMGAQKGGRAGADARKLDWIRKVHAGTQLTTSVCTGAFLLAQVGLLDGLEATTHHDFYDSLASKFPKVKVVRNRRIVDQGKIVTAGGEACSLDFGLWLVGRYYGHAAAQKTCDYMEYAGTAWRG